MYNLVSLVSSFNMAGPCTIWFPWLVPLIWSMYNLVSLLSSFNMVHVQSRFLHFIHRPTWLPGGRWISKCRDKSNSTTPGDIADESGQLARRRNRSMIPIENERWNRHKVSKSVTPGDIADESKYEARLFEMNSNTICRQRDYQEADESRNAVINPTPWPRAISRMNPSTRPGCLRWIPIPYVANVTTRRPMNLEMPW